MTFALPRAPRRTATAALAGLALLPAAGCGGDDGAAGAGDGLAGMAPAGTVFYAEGTVRPEGDRKSDLDALVAKFAPGRTVDQLVTEAFKDSGDDVDFERDVKPWLGERAALAVTGPGAGGGASPDVAGIVETTDTEKALAVLRKDPSATLDERSYGGADYLFEADGAKAGGIVDDKLVVGTEAAFKAVVDAAKGDGLDSVEAFTEVAEEVDEDALGFMYGDLPAALALAERSDARGAGAGQLDSVRGLLERQGIRTFAAGMVATPKAVTFRLAAKMKDDGQGEAAAKTLAALPAGSWAAFGLGDVGKALSDGLESLKSAGPGLDVERGLEQLEQQAGIDVQEDLLSWMGQAGVFARGASLTDIGGALVVQSKDPAATKAALAKARTLAAGGGLRAQDLTGSGIDDGFSVRAPGAPVEVFAALAGERFVLAVNRAALDEAINPARKLADEDAFKAAADQLGGGLKPTFFLDFPKVSGLIGLAAGDQPGFDRVQPYLDKITTIVAGSKRDGDLTLQTLSVGIR